MWSSYFSAEVQSVYFTNPANTAVVYLIQMSEIELAGWFIVLGFCFVFLLFYFVLLDIIKNRNRISKIIYSCSDEPVLQLVNKVNLFNYSSSLSIQWEINWKLAWKTIGDRYLLIENGFKGINLIRILVRILEKFMV